MEDLKLGDRVEVTGTIESRHRRFFGRMFKGWIKRRLPETLTGIVVRRSWKRSGVLEESGASFNSYYSEYEPGSNYLIAKKQHLVYEIAYNLKRKTITVSASQLRKVS